jgi:UDP-N-acetylglucosamine transferase subunit ALG13
VTIEVFVSVGTDHHPFDRLITWVDDWASNHPEVSIVVQHGYSKLSTAGENHAMMTGEQLHAHYDRADVVVAQVGPGTISDANAAGIVPIVVPRDPALGEVVDGHQYDFGKFMAQRGRCLMVMTRDDLEHALNQALEDSKSHRYIAEEVDNDATAAVSALVTDVLAAPRRRLSWRRVTASLRSVSSSH